jgi:hypothetical protein
VWREYPEALDLQNVDLWECALLCPTGLLPGERGRMAASLLERWLVGGPGEVDRELGKRPMWVPAGCTSSQLLLSAIR